MLSFLPYISQDQLIPSFMDMEMKREPFWVQYITSLPRLLELELWDFQPRWKYRKFVFRLLYWFRIQDSSYFQILGLPCGILCLIFVGILSYFSIIMMLECSFKQHVWSYADLMGKSLGKMGKLITRILVVTNNIGILIIYMIIIGKCVPFSVGINLTSFS